MTTVVKVYLYDTSKGIAKKLSPVVLGQQIGGIWHTAVVVYNHEFFFGNDGITHCKPGNTVLGPPDTVLDMGTTEVTEEIMLMHLHQLSENDFKVGKYSVMEHNCNTFANQFSLFLTGQGLPQYILDLPGLVLSSPMGAMLRPFLESLNVNPRVNDESDADSVVNFKTLAEKD